MQGRKFPKKIRRKWKTTRRKIPKPPYVVPSMAEALAVPKNGLKVVSTFTGAGGSCLGFIMAGYEMLWANEFIEAARETYAANFPNTPLDPRDIREVQPSEILEATGLEKGELDILEGSPPCSAFSMIGEREATWGKTGRYSDTEQRTDDLFFEFARILEGLQPKVFVAENVRGMVLGKAKGYFLDIKDRLRECGYKLAVRMVDAQWLGVPQHRERLIFVGVRNDLDAVPAFPTKLAHRYSLRDVLCEENYSFRGDSTPEELAEVRFERFAIGKEWLRLQQGETSYKYPSLIRPDPRMPCPCITQVGGEVSAASVAHPSEPRKFTIAELKLICSLPGDFKLVGSHKLQWERCGRAVPPFMMRAIAKAIAKGVLGV